MWLISYIGYNEYTEAIHSDVDTAALALWSRTRKSLIVLKIVVAAINSPTGALSNSKDCGLDEARQLFTSFMSLRTSMVPSPLIILRKRKPFVARSRACSHPGTIRS